MTKVIDYHHHIFPGGVDAEGKPWSLTASLKGMDRAGIDFSFANLGPVQGQSEDAISLAVRSANDFGVGVRNTHPDRFGLFVTIPMQATALALGEVQRGHYEMNCDGFSITTSTEGRWIGDPLHEPIFEALNDINALVFVHPNAAGAHDMEITNNYGAGQLSLPWLEFPANTARAILNLWVRKIPLRFPNIRFIFCHGGGVMPLLVGRIQGFSDWAEVGPRRLEAIFPKGIVSALRHFHFEISQTFHQPTLEFLVATLGEDRLLFGTDYPYIDPASAKRNFDNLILPEKFRRGILQRNLASAADLLP